MTDLPMCPICEKEVRPDQPKLREVRGWAEDRREGGTNHVYDKTETGAVAHKFCVRHGAPVDSRQGSML